ncbi:PLP-dependent transferase [Lojkania enalia]|uniref:PLP-dependent transferase n=1 Tax=Lojkania enalia TaxID=147567 RepID=A0A9P4MV15_9PLEO|nr:PLP-dependent transferase [Didymosphaeria enalia]
MKDTKTSSPLERNLHTTLENRRQRSILRTLTVNTQKIDFSSNDFLSLSKSPQLRSAFLNGLSSIPDSQIGSTGSRLLDGNSAYAEELERSIAAFHGAEAGLLFNSGFDANAGFFACVPQRGDFVVYDELIHASVHEGMRLSRASKRLPFKHNSVEDLRTVLKQCLRESESLRQGKAHVIIAVEAVYSMDGDLAPLKEVVDVVDEVLPKGSGYVVIDEAHSTGVIGPKGRGLVCELGLEKRIFVRLHTFGKALACNGAIILGSELLRLYLINYARPLIYSTFMSYPTLAAIKAAYFLLQQGHSEKLASHLRLLVESLFEELNTQSTQALRMLLVLPSECPKSPIFSIQATDPKGLAKHLQDAGMIVRAVMPPTVPEGTARVRICLHAGNTQAEIRKLVRSMESWAASRSRDLIKDTDGTSGIIAIARL